MCDHCVHYYLPVYLSDCLLELDNYWDLVGPLACLLSLDTALEELAAGEAAAAEEVPLVYCFVVAAAASAGMVWSMVVEFDERMIALIAYDADNGQLLVDVVLVAGAVALGPLLDLR